MVTDICFKEVLTESASEVFETMMFMALEKVPAEEAEMAEDTLLSSITFTGALEGCLAICCASIDAKEIAANMLGMEPDDDISMEDICDAMGEVANMVLGSVKKRIAETVGDIDVSIPCTVSGKMLDTSLGEKANMSEQFVHLDGTLVKFQIFYKNN